MPLPLGEHLEQLRTEVRRDRDIALAQLDEHLAKPLKKRLETFRTIGPLTIEKVVGRQIYLKSSIPEESFFSPQQPVRLSRNNPLQEPFIRGTFFGLIDEFLVVDSFQADEVGTDSSTIWTIDEDFVDLTHFYLETIEELGETTIGREKILPTLFGNPDTSCDPDFYNDTLDELEEQAGIDQSQTQAIANSVSAQCHLVQGPPGTGKTRTLAQTVNRLVISGKRIFVSGFTHRSINNALTKIIETVGRDCPVVKIGRFAEYERDEAFESIESIDDCDHDFTEGPFVIGATPFTLRSKRLPGIIFDHALIDETSQMTTPLAAMVMLRSKAWTFYGDQRQLPPVSFYYAQDPNKASVFHRLQSEDNSTSLNITYRLNADLTEWPSETFYGGNLKSHIDRKLSLLDASPPFSFLAGSPALVRIVNNEEDTRARNDTEVETVAQSIEHLLRNGLSPKEIGVVCPFRAQAAAIRGRLRLVSEDHDEVTVDTVDRFQGQERRIIFVSLATAHERFLSQMERFLANPQRLNVAVTRAQSKVVLLHSQNFADYCEKHAQEAPDTWGIAYSLLCAATVYPDI